MQTFIGRKTISACLVAAATTILGCGAADPVVVDETAAASTKIAAVAADRLIFGLNGFDGGQYIYDIDTVEWTLAGYRVSAHFVNGSREKLLLSSPEPISAVAQVQLTKLFSETELITLSTDACAATQRNRIDVDGSFPYITLEDPLRGPRFATGSGSCRRIDYPGDMNPFEAIDMLFLSLDPPQVNSDAIHEFDDMMRCDQESGLCRGG